MAGRHHGAAAIDLPPTARSPALSLAPSGRNWSLPMNLHTVRACAMCVCIRQAITADAYPLPENLVSESGRLRPIEEAVSAQGSIPRS
jgi:hypothetical protein